ncbi:MAG: PIG-L deacetylase family protein [Vicinamibacteria bacterium]
MPAEKVVLALSPHTDDSEFGAGGTLARMVEEGHRVVYVALSSCETSLPPGLAPDTLVHESRRATKELGIHDSRVLDFKVRYFPRDRQDILEALVRLQREIQPWLVLAPASSDIHQDHKTVHEEARRAFKQSNYLGYELPWNNITMNTNYFSRLTEGQLDKKVAALMCYESQKSRMYHRAEFIRAAALMRGSQVGAERAEAFEVIRWIE